MNIFQLNYNGEKYLCRENETLLDAFIRQGVELPFSCRKGSCHVCMLKCIDGEVSELSQKGLRSEYVRSNYFLPCSCIPTGDMSVESLACNERIISAIVHSKDALSESVCRILIEPAIQFDYNPGQYLRLIRNDGVSRYYSIAGMPEDYYLEFHVKRMPNGLFSNWVFDDLKIGDEIDLQGPFGSCFYHSDIRSDANIVLMGNSTGFSPLTGVLKSAITNSHTGKIFAFHLGSNWGDIYNATLLKEMASCNDKICIYQGLIGQIDCPDVPELIDSLKSEIPDLKDTEYFIAGSDTWVSLTSEVLSDYGVADNRIYSDSFEFNDLRQKGIPDSSHYRRVTDPLPDNNKYHNDKSLVIEGIWEALGQGSVLKLILQDFYATVYDDEKLSAFFHNTTIQRSIEKQFLFLRQKFTGEKVYFGDRPRNAHHWMVITDELFDYRKMLLSDCMRKYDLDEKYIEAWLAMEESFRDDIVKSKPWPRVVNGIEMPLNGYDVMVIDEGTICDGCQDAIDSGQTVRYHVRLGLTYCEHCIGGHAA